jgi:hypothetical protein
MEGGGSVVRRLHNRFPALALTIVTADFMVEHPLEEKVIRRAVPESTSQFASWNIVVRKPDV